MSLYLLLTLLVLNYNLFASFYMTTLPFLEKLAVTPYLFLTSISEQNNIIKLFHIIIGFLFALNIVLMTQKIVTLKNPSIKIGITAGIVSLATAGCASCGLSLLTLFGLGSALAFLPFQGVEILILTTLILLITCLYNLNTLAKVCKIEKKQ